MYILYIIYIHISDYSTNTIPLHATYVLAHMMYLGTWAHDEP